MPDTHTCTGDDVNTAREVLAAVVAEMNRRVESLKRQPNTYQWEGPSLHLTVDQAGAVVSDPTCLRLLEDIVKFGRKLGVTGEVRSDRGWPTGMPGLGAFGGSALLRDLLMVGVPLRWVPSPVHTAPHQRNR